MFWWLRDSLKSISSTLESIFSKLTLIAVLLRPTPEEPPEPKAIECFRCTKAGDCQFSQQYIFCRMLKHVLDGGTCPAYELDPSVDK